MPVTLQPVSLSFQDAAGNPIANGLVTFRLQVDIATAVANGPQISAGKITSAALDSGGLVTVSLWPNNVMSPPSVYFVQCYTAQGQLVWRGELTVTQ